MARNSSGRPATWPSSALARPLSNWPPIPAPAPSAPPARAVLAEGISSMAGVSSAVKMSDTIAALFSAAAGPGLSRPMRDASRRPRKTAITATGAAIRMPCSPLARASRGLAEDRIDQRQEADHAGAQHERQREHTAPSRSMAGAVGRSWHKMFSSLDLPSSLCGLTSSGCRSAGYWRDVCAGVCRATSRPSSRRCRRGAGWS